MIAVPVTANVILFLMILDIGITVLGSALGSFDMILISLSFTILRLICLGSLNGICLCSICCFFHILWR